MKSNLGTEKGQGERYQVGGRSERTTSKITAVTNKIKNAKKPIIKSKSATAEKGFFLSIKERNRKLKNTRRPVQPKTLPTLFTVSEILESSSPSAFIHGII
jgi:hypothetical protein